MSSSPPPLPPGPGLADRVHDAQRSFRALLAALAQPGLVQALGPSESGLDALDRVLLTLADRDTPVWWQHPDPARLAWLRFHTGALAAAAPAAAGFAVIDEPATMPPLAVFDAGTDEAPETSCTLLVRVPGLSGGRCGRWRGPGIDGERRLAPRLPATWWDQWAHNHARFPAGIDVVFGCGDALLGLPRSTAVALDEEAGCTSR